MVSTVATTPTNPSSFFNKYSNESNSSLLPLYNNSTVSDDDWDEYFDVTEFQPVRVFFVTAWSLLLLFGILGKLQIYTGYILYRKYEFLNKLKQ